MNSANVTSYLKIIEGGQVCDRIRPLVVCRLHLDILPLSLLGYFTRDVFVIFLYHLVGVNGVEADCLAKVSGYRS